MGKDQQKQTGSFYTEGKVAESVTAWAICSSHDTVLEPSFGDGVFLDKAYNRFRDLGSIHPSMTTVELQPEVAESAKRRMSLFPKPDGDHKKADRR